MFLALEELCQAVFPSGCIVSLAGRGRWPAAQPRQRSAPFGLAALSVCGGARLCGFIGHFLVIKGGRHFFICLLNVCELSSRQVSGFRFTVCFDGFPILVTGFCSRILSTNTLSDRCPHVCVTCVYIFVANSFDGQESFLAFGNIQFTKFLRIYG